MDHMLNPQAFATKIQPRIIDIQCDDLRARDDYRRAMIGVIARRAASVALARARGESFPIPATPAFMEGSAR